MMYELSKQFRFEAAHSLPGRTVAAEGSRRIHGHSYRGEVFVRGLPVEATGMVIDLGLLKQAIEEVEDALDHRLLDDVEGLGRPTMENICLFVWRRLAPKIAGLQRVAVYRDSSGESCVFFGPDAAA